jgi:hypothetical protein
MHIQHTQNLFQYKKEDLPEVIVYIRGTKIKLPKLDKEQQREVLMLASLGLKNYEIQYLMHLKHKEKLGQKWKN